MSELKLPINKTVLVAEDEMALQEAIKLKLEQAGVNVLTANNGAQALEIMTKVVPDLLWLDVLMPKMNGLEVLTKARQDERLKNMPVLIASVSGSPEKVKQAFALGATDYMVKSQYKIDSMITRALDIMKDKLTKNN